MGTPSIRLQSRRIAGNTLSYLLSKVTPHPVSATANPGTANDVSPGKLKPKYKQPENAKNEVRKRLGRSISPDAIETAAKKAEAGQMQDLTDISRETVKVDPHLASVLMKRFFAVSALPWEVQPADGIGIDRAKALEYAAVVNSQIRRMSNFKQSIYDMAWGRFDGRAAFELDWDVAATPMATQSGKVNMLVNQLLWIHPRRLSFGSRHELRILDEGEVVRGSFSSVGMSLHEADLRSAKMWRKFISWTPRMLCDYPEREGLAPSCLYWSFFKRFSARDRMQLIELFGKPWRIIEVDADADLDEEDLAEADQVVDALGYSYSARLPQGAELKVHSPGTTAGQTHQQVIDDANKELSKLVLGQTGTTDGVPAGINSNQTDVMADEQTLILRSDASAIGDVIESGLCDAIIEVNFGPDQLDHAPRFVLRSDRPVDRNTEIERLTGALNNGLHIKQEEAYEVVGFSIPEGDDVVVRVDQPAMTGITSIPQAPRPLVVVPAAGAPGAGTQGPASDGDGEGDGRVEIAIGVDSVASIVTVNEARESQGLSPLTLPDGSDDPDGGLTISEFREKKMALATEAEPADGDVDVTQHKERLSALASLVSKDNAVILLRAVLAGERSAGVSNITLASDGEDEIHEQPESEFGSPEDLLTKGRKEMMRTAKLWADSAADAIDGLSNPNEIVKTLRDVFEEADIQPYARALERRMAQGAALGAMDHALEIGDLEPPAVSATSGGQTRVNLAFSTMPFNQAVSSFIKRGIVSRAVWDTLRADVKRKSFTIAGVQSSDMRQKIFETLAKEIENGADLRYFKKTMFEALKSAGMIAVARKGGLLGASHIETVFRTNVLNAYNYGRYQHASQPSVAKRFPVWEIVAVQDDRGKDRDHRRSSGIRLLATDPFWKRAYPPFGFNCRCRVRSRSAKYMDTVVSGDTITWLPDPGFTSGYSGLI